MHKQSANRSMQNSTYKHETNRYKDMSYVNHQQKYPLQLDGRMRRHSQPFGQQNIKSIINYDACRENRSTINTNQNCHNGQVGQNSRYLKSQQNSRKSICENSALAQKILSNNKLASTNYEKSVVPQSDPRSSKFRPQSVKTFKQNRQGSGLNYVMATQQKYLYKVPQRRHVQEYHAPRRDIYGKRCNLSATKQNESSQIVTCLNQNKLNENIPVPNHQQGQKSISNNSSIVGVVHPQTTNKRILNDIHSSFEMKQSEEKPAPMKVKYDSQNMFKTGAQLGYEYKKSKEIGGQKVMEMMGSQYNGTTKGNTESLRQKRDDWRRSTIVIQ